MTIANRLSIRDDDHGKVLVRIKLAEHCKRESTSKPVEELL
jgi:hypothetical protein